jgi:ACT domain-containing protein
MIYIEHASWSGWQTSTVEAQELTQLAEETDLNIQAAAAIQESSTQLRLTVGRQEEQLIALSLLRDLAISFKLLEIF